MGKLLDNTTIKAYKSEDYNFIFNKVTGTHIRWGRTKEDDPQYSMVGPEILDLEISTGKCSGNCKFCFPSGESVLTPSGETQIDKISVGDKVVSFSEKDRESVVNTVLEKYERDFDGILYEIELSNGKLIRVTDEHPFLLTNGSWKLAKDLTNEDELMEA